MASCLINRLQNFIELSEPEKEFVAYMEESEREMKRGSNLIEIGAKAEELYVLKFGWLVARSEAERGRSAITRIYIPGEVIGLAEIGKGEAVQSLTMKTDGVVCPFPRRAVAEMFSKVPRLAALLLAIGSLDQLALRRQIKELTLMDAETRMAAFLLTMQDRLTLATSGRNRRYHLPLTNRDLADALGMTDVYVARVLKRLIEAGRIAYKDRHVTILDRESWIAEIGHTDIYYEIDTGWFPAA